MGAMQTRPELEEKVQQLLERATREELDRRPELFWSLMGEAIEAADPEARPPHPFPVAEEHMISKIVGELRRDGYSWWRGLFDERSFLNEATGVVDSFAHRWRDIFTDEPEEVKRVTDEESRVQFSRDAFPHDGHLCTCLRNKPGVAHPPLVDTLVNDDRITEVVSRYFGVDAWVHAVQCETLQVPERPDPRLTKAEGWHFDKLYDQIEAIVFLTDVDENCGPVGLKPGTHRWQRDLEPYYHRVFVYGASEGCMPAEIAERLPGEEVLGTCGAGDVLFLDTFGAHTGTLCTVGERLSIALSFHVKTARNEWLWRLGAR